MIVGRFGGTTNGPFIEGLVNLPQLNITGDVSFLVDTGAHTTVLAPADAIRLGVDYDRLTGAPKEFTGIGGIGRAFVEPSLISFVDWSGFLQVYELPGFSIMAKHPDLMRVPSLLGRDVLNQWEITYNFSVQQLHASIVTSSYTTPMPELVEPPAGTA